MERDAALRQVVLKVDTLALVETAYILTVLKKFHGNRIHAAAALGISLRTLRNKLHHYHEEAAEISDGGTIEFGTSNLEP